MKASTKARWAFVSGGVLVVALLIRLAIGFFGAFQLDGDLIDFAVIVLLALGLSTISIVAIVRVNTSSWHRSLTVVLDQDPTVPAFATTVLPEVIEAVGTFGQDLGLREYTSRVVKLGEFECSWWSGASNLTQVATIRSIDRIRYEVVRAPYRGRTLEALQATIQTNSGKHSFPMFLADDREGGFLPQRAEGVALQAIAVRLGALKNTQP
jgi:hypothetical protein